MRALVRDDSLFLHAEDIMNKSFKFLQTKDEYLSKKLFKKFKITAIPILDEMKIKDIIELWDVSLNQDSIDFFNMHGWVVEKNIVFRR